MKNDGFYKALLDDLSDGVYFVDGERRIEYWNKGAERLTGYSRNEVLGKRCSDNILNHVDEAGNNLCNTGCPVAATLEDGRFREMEIYLHHKSGYRIPIVARVSPVRDENGDIVGAVEVFSDNSPSVETRHRVRELEQMALLDHLTSLGNRRYLEEQIEARLAEFHRFGWYFGIIFIDLDHFKQINDTHGHDVGDETLKMVARTLEVNSRPFDLVGRWGGEEFIAVIRNVDRDNLIHVAERYRSLVKQSGIHRNTELIRITISLGAAMVRNEDTLDSLVKRADRCLYASKNRGRDCVSTDENYDEEAETIEAENE